MVQNQFMDAVSNIDSDIVERFIRMDNQLQNKTVKKKNTRLKWAAIAACFCLIIVTVVIVPMWHKDSKHSVPNPNVSTSQNIPPETVIEEKPTYTAKDIAKLFDSYLTDSVATNAYQTLYVQSREHLYFSAIPEDAYVRIYEHQASSNPLNKDEFKDFVSEILPRLCATLNVSVPSFEIQEKSSYLYKKQFTVDTEIGKDKYNFYAYQRQSDNTIFLSSRSDNREIILDGENVQVDQRLTEDEIIASVASIKDKLCQIFGVSFEDIKVIKRYDSHSQNGVCGLDIYFYNKEAHPLNAIQQSPVTDYIKIYFDNYANYTGDIVSDSIINAHSIRYVQKRVEASKAYPSIALTKRITLQEAEALLYKGYVFGGHSCPLCMALQDKVTFENYDYVGFEYQFEYSQTTDAPTTGIPFYTFYKKIGSSPNGNLMYAKTYVPAVEVEGYEDYFQNQTKKHPRNVRDVVE